MCLIAWNWQPDHPIPLVLLANRDEFYARPTRSLHWWPDSNILAGRDLQAGGTWLGISHNGRLAALTNYRDPFAVRADAPTRGELVSSFLTANTSAAGFLRALVDTAKRYNPFNLLVFDGNNLMGMESRHARVVTIGPGVGAVSNADFQTPWPKLMRLRTGLQSLVDQNRLGNAPLLELLQDRQIAADADLPVTGVPVDIERALSAAFITLPGYGTRASSIVRFDATQVEFLEYGFDANGETESNRETVTLNPGASC